MGVPKGETGTGGAYDSSVCGRRENRLETTFEYQKP